MEQKLPIFFQTWAGLPATIAVLSTSSAAAGATKSTSVASARYRVLVIGGLSRGLLVPRGGNRTADTRIFGPRSRVRYQITVHTNLSNLRTKIKDLRGGCQTDV